MSTSPIDVRAIIPSLEEMEAMGRRRYQKPSVLKTSGKNKSTQQWFFRYRVDVTIGAGETKRVERTKYLGLCSEMGKREAEQLRDQVLSEVVNKPAVVLMSQVMYGAILTEFLEFVGMEVRNNTYLNYQSIIETHIRPTFGKMRLCDMTPQVCQRWLNQLSKVLARGSRKRNLVLFRQVWERAIEWGYTREVCPLRKATLGPIEQGRTKTLPTVDQFRQIYQILEQPYRSMLTVATFTGMTISEIRGLQYGDINGDSVTLHRSKDQQNLVNAPKNQHRSRTVPIGHIRDAFRLVEKPAKDEFIFPPAYQTALYNLKAAAKAVGIEYEGFGWHTFRRVSVTWGRRAGQSQADSMAQHGHTEKKTNDVYYIENDLDLKRRAEAEAALFERVMFGGDKGGRA